MNHASRHAASIRRRLSRLEACPTEGEAVGRVQALLGEFRQLCGQRNALRYDMARRWHAWEDTAEKTASRHEIAGFDARLLTVLTAARDELDAAETRLGFPPLRSRVRASARR